MSHSVTVDEPQLPTAPGGILDRDDPESLLHMLPDQTAERVIRAHKLRPELFGLDYYTLERTLKKEGKIPIETDRVIQMKFWNEYERASNAGTRMYMKNVYGRLIADATYFHNDYLWRVEKVAWMLTYPADYAIALEEMLIYGARQIREIFDLPNHDDDGKVNVKLLEVKLKAYNMLDQRVNGSVTQRIEQKSMQLNVSTTDKDVAQMGMLSSMEEIEKRLKELRRRDRLAGPVEVKNEDTP